MEKLKAWVVRRLGGMDAASAQRHRRSLAVAHEERAVMRARIVALGGTVPPVGEVMRAQQART